MGMIRVRSIIHKTSFNVHQQITVVVIIGIQCDIMWSFSMYSYLSDSIVLVFLSFTQSMTLLCDIGDIFLFLK